MSSHYTGYEDDRRYTGEEVTVHYNIKRCIHARECVTRLSNVFDVKKRPWINPTGAEGNAIVDTVNRCPSGALHATAEDGVPQEQTPDHNIIHLWQDGPLQVYGDISIVASGVDVSYETRATLCRCGSSNNKPFCDNSHKEVDFHASDINPIEGSTLVEASGGKLMITAHANGPLGLSGQFEIKNSTGETLFSGKKTSLCRCGHSSRKPFCDGTHNTIGFEAE
jgi:CDGSH-type Zn-finger protein/uncharacterized Fe-S cluster protein YjdI